MTAPSDDIWQLPALSVMQPYAWLLAAGWKDIENRDWKDSNPGLKFRGRFLIHTGKRMFPGFHGPDDWDWPHITRPDRLDLGGIVGVAEIVDAVTASTSEWFYGKWGLVIRNAALLPFRPCLGQRGFFRPDFSPGAHPRVAGAPQAAA